MDRRVVLLAALSTSTGACFVLGDFDFDVEPRAGDTTGAVGGGGTSGEGGGAAGGSGGVGGMAPCTELEGMPCYTGPAWTRGVADCHGGTWACDGEGNATCEGEVAATAEVCSSTRTDDNCDTYLLCSGELSWHVRNPDTGFQIARRARADLEGNVYVVGDFEGSLSLPMQSTLISEGARDMFVAKLDREGNMLWVKAFGSADDVGASTERGADLVPHPLGGVVIAGRLEGIETAGGTSADPGPLNGLFLARLDASGVVVWANAYESTAGFTDVALATNGAGDVFVAGGFKGNLKLGAISLQNLEMLDDVFLARFDADGNDAGARKFGGSALDYARGVAVAPDGRVAIGGLFNGQVSFGSTPLTPGGSNDAFVAVFPSDPFTGSPDPLFAGSWGDSADQSVTDLAFAPDDSLAFVGYFAGNVDFGVRQVGDGATHHACMARLSTSYTVDLAHCWDAPGKASLAWGVAVDGVGNIVVSGQYVQELEAPPQVRFGGDDLFITKMAPDGTSIWTKLFGGDLDDHDARVGVDLLGNVLVGAKGEGLMELPDGDIPGADEDAMILKLLP